VIGVWKQRQTIFERASFSPSGREATADETNKTTQKLTLQSLR
jgi:hypothetical protein